MKRIVKLLFIILAFAASTSLFSQPVIHLVKDIALGSNGSDPQLFTASNNQLFFAATNQSQKINNKLWKSDGTEQGTLEVTPSLELIGIQQTALINNSLFYWTNVNSIGGLYKTDGTEAGTQLLLSNNYAAESYYWGVNSLFNFNGKLFFVASHNKLGDEPHISDGTPAGTFLLKDIAKGDNVSSYLSEIMQVGNLLYFTAYHELKRELWCTDGTSEGTRLVIDLNIGAGSSMQFNSSYSIAYKDTLFFTVSTISQNSNLYKTGGTSESTDLVKSFAYGIMNGSLFVHNGFMYFLADTDNTGFKLWKSDGTAAGTVQLTSQGNWSYTPKFISVNHWLYFVHSTPSNGAELWKTDGTPVNTTLVKDIRTGSDDAFEGTIHLTTINGTLFFMANDGTHGKELWKSDGTAAGTQLVKDINIGAKDAIFEKPVVYKNQLYFVSNDANDPAGQEGWRSDGTDLGTVMLKNIKPELGLFDIRPEVVFQNKLYLSAKVDGSGSEVWVNDGNTLSQLKEINTTPADAYPNKETHSQRIIGLNNTLFFSADNIRYGRELWMTKGTEATTRLVRDFTKVATTLWYNSTNTDSYFNDMIVYKNHLFIIVNGNQFWKIDEDGNAFIILQNSADQSNYSGNFTIFKGELYFRFGWSGRELWHSDGIICNKVNFPIDNNPDYFFDSFLGAKDFLFCSIYFNSNNSTEFWKIDNNGAVPQKVKGGVYGYVNGHFLELDNLLLFPFVNRTNSSYDQQIWRTDGTSEGTYLLKEINPNGDDGVAGWKFLYYKKKAYFLVDAGPNRQIWSTDGTTQETRLFIELDQDRLLDLFDIVNGQLIFHSFDPYTFDEPIYRWNGTTKEIFPVSNDIFKSFYHAFTHNQKSYLFYFNRLWESNATAIGTQDITNRSISGIFQNEATISVQSHNGKFYFTATSPQYGTELFVQEAEILPSVAIKDNPERGQYIKYQATGAITATNQPTSYSTNSYQSNTSVTLEPGFETQPYATFTAEIATPALGQASAAESVKVPNLVSNDLTVSAISRYEIEPALSKIQNSVIYRTFKYPDVSKPMPTISVSKEKLNTGQTRYTFVVISEGKMHQESVDVF